MPEQQPVAAPVCPLPRDATIAVAFCAACGQVYGVAPGVPADPNRESIVRALSGE